MNRYFKLVNMEINRFSKFLFGMIIGVFIIQVSGLIIKAKTYMSDANESLMNGVTKETFIYDYGQYGMRTYMDSMWFNIPIALCAGAIFLYIFLIWYRDWSGKNSFIYRLLMIPTSRLSIYFAKITALMLLVFSLVSAQLVFLFIESKILGWIISADYLKEMSIISLTKAANLIQIILPSTFTQFILYYGAGFVSLTIIFTAILLERSFKWKGIILGIIYCGVTIAIFVAILLLLDTNYFYISEIITIASIVGSLIGVISILLSRYLLNKKVTV